MKANISERTFEQFSAYLDGQLSPVEAKNLEEQIRLNPEWRSSIEELASTRKLLRSAPRYRAPRNFTISAETARSLAHKPLFPPFPAFRFSTVVATLAILGVAALQVIGLSGPAASMVAMAPQTAEREIAPMDSAEMQKSQLAEPTQVLQGSQPDGSIAPPLALDMEKAVPVPAPSGGIVTYGNQAAPEFAAGKGGGGPGSSTYTLPLEAVSGSQILAESMPASPENEQPLMERSETTHTEGNGPILGVPDPGDEGQIIATVGPAAANPILPKNSGEESVLAGMAPLRIGQIALGVLAMLAAAAALVFRARRI